MIGQRTQSLSFKDLKPTHVHWVLLAVAALVAAVAVLADRTGLITGSAPRFFAGAALGTTVVFTAMALGGPSKLFLDWWEKNFWGYDWVLRWDKDAQILRSHFSSRHARSEVVFPGWSLYVPLGGWFNRPFLSHSATGRMKLLSVTRLKWDGFGIYEFTVADKYGSRLAVYHAWILSLLEEVHPDGEVWSPNHSLWSIVDSSRSGLLGKIRTLTEDRDEKWRKWLDLKAAVTTEVGGMLQQIDAGTRLKTTREGKAIHQGLIALRARIGNLPESRPAA